MSAAISSRCQRVADSLVSAERGTDGHRRAQAGFIPSGPPSPDTRMLVLFPRRSKCASACPWNRALSLQDTGKSGVCCIRRSTRILWNGFVAFCCLGQRDPNLCRRRTADGHASCVLFIVAVPHRWPGCQAGLHPTSRRPPSTPGVSYLTLSCPLSLDQDDGSPLSALPASLSHKYPCCPCLGSVSGLQQNRLWSRKTDPAVSQGRHIGPSVVRPT